MICVTYSGTAVVFQDPQPATITDETCTYVLQKPSEIEHSPFVLTTGQGVTIGNYLLFICALAWGIRKVCQVISDRSNSQED